ncbi:MAG: DUF3570 domain-containing protein [Alcanivoracaceae bacterium]|nr:DUF3570 domain-containing protein [Alcanivoracaceae bacterium]
MQLKKKKPMLSAGSVGNISCALAAATCSLIALPVHAAEGEDGWKVDSAVLYYSEQDRVTAVEPVVSAGKTFADDSELQMKLTLDSLTGASHNGAMVLDQPQTFTSPSGSEYDVAPGEVPLDDSFKDTRVAFNAQYTRPWTRTLRWTAGANFSNEYDFQSFGVNAGLLWDLNQKNTTLTLAFSHEADTINAVGDIPDPLTSMPSPTTTVAATTKQTLGASDTRSVNDILLGWTQVMNRRWIMQLNYNLSSSSGYHNDPYKVVTVYDPNTDIVDDYLFESRPDSRTKNSIYWENRYHLTDDVLALGYRYMTDDWGVTSHTLDASWRHEMANGWYLQPHLRYYTQSAADFWHEYVTPGEVASLEEATGDYRLGNLDDMTYGLKFGRKLSKGREWNARVEMFQQSGDTDAAEVDALITQVGYTFYW